MKFKDIKFTDIAEVTSVRPAEDSGDTMDVVRCGGQEVMVSGLSADIPHEFQVAHSDGTQHYVTALIQKGPGGIGSIDIDALIPSC